MRKKSTRYVCTSLAEHFGEGIKSLGTEVMIYGWGMLLFMIRAVS